MTPAPELVAARDRLKAWLLDRAFPIWWRPGADLERGGFHDRLDVSGRPLPGGKRARVAARQAYAYAVAGQMGWSGPWREAMDHGLNFLERGHLRPDGLYRTRAAPPDDEVVLYDQAFVLFALAHAGDDIPAEELFDRLPRHPGGGFAEFAGDGLNANPNMHLFEAFLAWAGAGGDSQWRTAAAGQARLALTRLIDPETGALSEHFHAGWSPPAARADRRVEPGHQFEWAWLLMRWSEISGDAAALSAALRLVELGERVGVDPQRNVAVNALDGDLQPTDMGARLWPQTERLRAALLAGVVTGDAACWDIALRAALGLEAFLDETGLWRDSLEGEDRTAPASSLYHVVGAIQQLDRAVKGRG